MEHGAIARPDRQVTAIMDPVGQEDKIISPGRAKVERCSGKSGVAAGTGTQQRAGQPVFSTVPDSQPQAPGVALPCGLVDHHGFIERTGQKMDGLVKQCSCDTAAVFQRCKQTGVS